MNGSDGLTERQNGHYPLSYARFRDSVVAKGLSPEEVPALYGAYTNGAVSGAAFLFEEKDKAAVPVWGRDHQIAWASGEPLIICGGDGVGKTTIAQQVALARLRGGAALGFPVAETTEPVLYIAADRPRQAKRSFKRMVDPEDYKLLDEKLIVTRGHFRINQLTEQAQKHGAGTVIVDTLGAAAPGNLASDDVGLEVYHALQEACAAEIEVMLLHHSRKRGEHFRGLDEVYGSRWITAPCGSIIFLRGNAGASEVFLQHLKQPDEPIGPGKVYHDHAFGRSYLE